MPAQDICVTSQHSVKHTNTLKITINNLVFFSRILYSFNRIVSPSEGVGQRGSCNFFCVFMSLLEQRLLLLHY